MRLSDFIEQSNAVGDTAELLALFGRAIGDLGFDRHAYADLTPSLTVGAPPDVHALSYPADWVSHYFERGYDRIDPSSLQLTATARPFAWSQLRELRSMTPDQAYVLEEARAAGLRTGVSVPLHGPYGTLGAVALASSAIVDVSQQHLDHLNSLAAQLHAAHSALTEPSAPLMPPVKLTPRERECLLWCARGKSNWEIGMILKISENSVKFHLKNAMSRLNSTSRILSVVKAIRLGLILP